MVAKAAVRRREKKKRKASVVDQTAGMAERAATSSSICLSDRQGRDGAQNSGKKGSPFWDPLIEGERAREPQGAHPSLTLFAKCEVLKRHCVDEREGDLGTGF